MTQEAHTPEPWAVSGVRYKMGGCEWQNITSYDAALKCDVNLAAVSIDPRTLDGIADARRIVACVNALAGIPIEAIEGDVVAELVGAADAIERYLRETPHHNATQAAALRAALAKLEASK
jgi:hypothetical protein